MGRHGQPPPPREVPREALAWGGFATSTTAALLWWSGATWTVVAFVAATGVVCTALIAVLSTLAPRRREPAARQPADQDRTYGP